MLFYNPPLIFTSDSAGSPAIIVTGTFTPPAWDFSGNTLVGSIDDTVEDFSGATSVTLQNITEVNGSIIFTNKADVVLASLDGGVLATVTGDVSIGNFTHGPQLSTIDLSNLGTVSGHLTINITYGGLTTSIDLSELSSCSQITVLTNGVLTLPSVPGNCVFLEINGTANTSLPDLTSLSSCTTFIVTSNENVVTAPDFSALSNCTIFNFISSYAGTAVPSMPAAMTSCSDFEFSNTTALVSPPTIPQLASGAQFEFNNHVAMTAGPDCSVIVNLGQFDVSGDVSMVTAPTFPNLKSVSSNAFFSGNAFSQAAVDYLLAVFAALDGTNGTTSWDNSTFYIDGGTNATPSAAGLASIAVLVGRGNTVNHN